MNAKQHILTALRAGQKLTTMTGFTEYGTSKLPTRIGELKDEGWKIKSAFIKTRSGKRVKQYWM